MAKEGDSVILDSGAATAGSSGGLAEPRLADSDHQRFKDHRETCWDRD